MNQYWRLIRPGLLALVLFSMTVAALTAGQSLPEWPRLLHALAGTALVIVGAGAINQRIEWRSDAKMDRTAGRPLPSREMTPSWVATFGAAASMAGTAYLAVAVDATVAALAAGSWGVYVLIYTPLKSRTAWQTPVGALAGAMPMLMGAATADALGEPAAMGLFALVFCWQFPHTMAIAWIYRRQYAAAGVQVASVVDPSGRLAGRLAVGGAVCLLAVSLLPWMFASAGVGFAALAVFSGSVHIVFALRFLRQANDATARALWRAALVHLPLLLLAGLWRASG